MSSKLTFRQKVYHTIEDTGPIGSSSWIFDAVLVLIILLNVAAIILETLPGFFHEHKFYFLRLEEVSVMFFIIEYILRVWCIVEDKRFTHPFKGRIRFMITPMAIIDLLAILPVLAIFFRDDADFVKIFSVIRIFRFLKVVRYMKVVSLFINVIRDKAQELFFTFLFLLFMLVLVSTAMYHIEHPAQPDKFSSIPATMWWGVVTLTTIGYGDIYPITPLGKLVGGLIMIIGVGILAVPTGILAAGFSAELKKHKEHDYHHRGEFCPHCGKRIPD